MLTLLFVILAILMVVSIPTWRHSRAWGYRPASGVGLVLLVLVILTISGRL
jgi:hypothetical protein